MRHTRISDRLSGFRPTATALFQLLRSRQIHIPRVGGIMANLLACLRDRQPPCPPPVLQVDITNTCNLKCPGCLTGLGLHKNRGHLMPWEKFAALVDEVRDGTLLVALYNSGEPFMHPRIFDMIQYLDQNRIASMISTNGHFLASRENAERLVSSGLSTLIISLSGTTQATYSQYHRGGHLSTVIQSIRQVILARKKAPRKTPTVITRFLVMDHNRHETEAMKRLAADLDCDLCEFRTVNWQPRLINGNQPPPAPAETGKLEKSSGRVCLWPWLMSTVNWNGEVFPCCFSHFDIPVMGNAFEPEGFRKVWRNKAYTTFRKQMRTGKNHLPVCRQCPAETGFQSAFSRQHRTVYVNRHE